MPFYNYDDVFSSANPIDILTRSDIRVHSDGIVIDNTLNIILLLDGNIVLSVDADNIIATKVINNRLTKSFNLTLECDGLILCKILNASRATWKNKTLKSVAHFATKANRTLKAYKLNIE